MLMSDSARNAVRERRKTPREAAADREVRCQTELADGTVLEGIVENVSKGGAKISGLTTGLSIGHQINLVFAFLTGEKVKHRGVVRHVDPGGKSFGLKFTSDPRQIRAPEHKGPAQ